MTGGPTYKIWYWDTDANLYSIDAIAYAESSDGVAWTDGPAISQGSPKLVTGIWPGWNIGSYGPVDVIYQPGASNTGTDPWGYSYLMYYDGTDGSSEVTGLAYSIDGKAWTAYTSNPVLDKGTGNSWDCDDAAYGTVYRDVNGYHFWYSGGGGDNGGTCATGDPVSEGIGYASSPDGLTWTKDVGNPIFHIDDGVAYRDSRVYTPAIVDDGSGILKMYYSARGGSGPKNIGLAVLNPYTYTFEGFFQPIDNAALNIAKAGQTIPVRWRITDATGAPVSDPGSFVRIRSVGTLCAGGTETDTIETYSGDSGLLYLGDGNWQFNWKTPKSFAGQCRTMKLTLADGTVHTASFQFK